jgi:hypothetical protein
MVSARYLKSSFPTSNIWIKGGEWKPNQYCPLPKEVSLARSIQGKSMCPGSLFQSLHRHNSTTVEYYKMAPNFPQVYDEAEQTIHDMQEFDGAKNVIVIIAHDSAPLRPRSGVKFFNGNLNNWKNDKLDGNFSMVIFGRFFFCSRERGKAKQETELEAGLSFKPQ